MVCGYNSWIWKTLQKDQKSEVSIAISQIFRSTWDTWHLLSKENCFHSIASFIEVLEIQKFIHWLTIFKTLSSSKILTVAFTSLVKAIHFMLVGEKDFLKSPSETDCLPTSQAHDTNSSWQTKMLLFRGRTVSYNSLALALGSLLPRINCMKGCHTI